MFSGQSEEQARRKILAVLLDETRKVLESARELTNVYKFVTEGKRKDIELSIIKISKAEDEIESFRRALTRELAEVGSIIMNREDLLRTAYEIEEIAGRELVSHRHHPHPHHRHCHIQLTIAYYIQAPV